MLPAALSRVRPSPVPPGVTKRIWSVGRSAGQSPSGHVVPSALPSDRGLGSSTWTLTGPQPRNQCHHRAGGEAGKVGAGSVGRIPLTEQLLLAGARLNRFDRLVGILFATTSDEGRQAGNNQPKSEALPRRYDARAHPFHFPKLRTLYRSSEPSRDSMWVQVGFSGSAPQASQTGWAPQARPRCSSHPRWRRCQ